MGSVSLKIGDDTARFRYATVCSSTLQLLRLAYVVSANLFALYPFSFSPSPFATANIGNHRNLFDSSSSPSTSLSSFARSRTLSVGSIRSSTRSPDTKPSTSPSPAYRRSSSSSLLAILSPSAATPTPTSPPWYPPSPIPVPTPPPLPSSPPSCPTATPPLAPPPTLSSPSSSPRLASPSAASPFPFPDLSGIPTSRTPFHLVGRAVLARWLCHAWHA